MSCHTCTYFRDHAAGPLCTHASVQTVFLIEGRATLMGTGGCRLHRTPEGGRTNEGLPVSQFLGEVEKVQRLWDKRQITARKQEARERYKDKQRAQARAYHARKAHLAAHPTLFPEDHTDVG